jgi:hypothetical protein
MWSRGFSEVIWGATIGGIGDVAGVGEGHDAITCQGGPRRTPRHRAAPLGVPDLSVRGVLIIPAYPALANAIN